MKIIVLILMLMIGAFSFSDDDKKEEKKQVEKGARLFKKYGCTSCHGLSGKGLGNLQKAYLKYSDQQLIDYIKNPTAFNNPKMPRYERVIAQQEMQPIIYYVKHLGKSAEVKPK